MSRTNDGEPAGAAFPFDWDDFQTRFFGDGGWKEAWNGGAGTIPWVDQYVRQVLAKAVPDVNVNQARPMPPDNKSTSPAVACSVFETHRAIIARIRLSPDVDPRAVRLFAYSHELKVTGLPGEREKTIKLPVPVRVDGTKAVCRQRVVEVTMPKEEASPVKEIPIRHGD
ncbi:Hsp20/alpha crystallin family protein [Paenibacillus flagellatus]|uniref:SHSP domain-containing protein n=1 Tax=Paenibacillus flagellatus TaxID=2211139 RepID=A0A2V5KBG5_9BACL|nr:Hsp20/alpha crystallin family protein [Paenibacillus flagellatus]PYI55454.1 hypothetical protein DLM86_06880 [Paenibacillus flagellatus]